MTKLIDVCEFIVDCPHSTAQDEGRGYPLIRTPNIGKGRFNLDGVHRVSESVYTKRNLRATPQDNDLIFAREAPAGNVAIIKNGEKFCLGQRTVLIRPNPKYVYPDFLTYFLLAPQQQYELLGTANGATVAHVNLPTIRNLEINLPELEVQHRIADILSAYDDLIENNRKQIKLLEEVAQRLYKEWFVDLRFPGHVHTKITDGVPEGWKRRKLVDIAQVQYGYAFDGSLFNSQKIGTPIIRIRNIPQGQTEDYTPENVDSQYLVYNGDIIVGMDGEFHINTWAGDTAYLVQRTCRIKALTSDLNGFLLWAIYEPIKYFEKTVVGATVAHLGKKHIDTVEILVPTEKFYLPFKSLFEARLLLMNQNRALAEARDRLLPKLMSGEVEV